MGLGALLLSRTTGVGKGNAEAVVATPFPAPVSVFIRQMFSEVVGSMPENQDEGAHWVKSSLSYSNGACVEVADLPSGVVGVRHSKDPEGPVLRFTPAEWHAFLGGAQLGEFDSFGA